MKLIIVLMLIIVLFYLARASYCIITKQQDGEKMAQALTWRIGLSLLTFAMLLFGLAMGWLHPHGLA